LAGEQVLAEAAGPDLELRVLRLPVVYGDAINRSGFVSALTDAATQPTLTSRVRWPGTVGLVSVQDVAAVLCALALAPEPIGDPEPGYLVAEVRAIAELFAAARMGDGRPAVERGWSLALPHWLWRGIGGSLDLALRAERWLPGGVYNPLWQLAMMCSSGLAAEPSIPAGLEFEEPHIERWLGAQGPTE
jgi:hypothetical protein